MRAYTFVLTPDADGASVLRFDAFSNVIVIGSTPEQTRLTALKTLLTHLDLLMAHGFPIPEPVPATSHADALVLDSITVLRIEHHNEGVRVGYEHPDLPPWRGVARAEIIDGSDEG